MEPQERSALVSLITKVCHKNERCATFGRGFLAPGQLTTGAVIPEAHYPEEATVAHEDK